MLFVKVTVSGGSKVVFKDDRLGDTEEDRLILLDLVRQGLEKHGLEIRDATFNHQDKLHLLYHWKPVEKTVPYVVVFDLSNFGLENKN